MSLRDEMYRQIIMNIFDSRDEAERMEFSLEKVGDKAERLCVSWERFIHEEFNNEKEKGVCAREFELNTIVYSLSQLKRVALLAFKAGLLSQKKERLRIKIRRLCD